MKPLRAQELATIVAGEVAPPYAEIPIGPEVVIDSRQVSPGALFVALPGDQVDGHRFVTGALADGAAAVLVSRAGAAAAGIDVLSLPAIVVDDPQVGLGQLSRAVVDEASAAGLTVVGITGSMGKTSTKDLLAHILASQGPTVAPLNSFNNEVGVPLTATRVNPDTRYLVSEMGARGVGHIAYLCELTPPAIGVVLNVAHAHIGEFGSQAAIAQAKGELAEGARDWAVLNADDQLVAAMAARTKANLAWFSVAGRPCAPGQLRVWATDITSDRWQRYSFTVQVEGTVATEPVVRRAHLQTPGRVQVANAIAALTAAIAAGVAPEAAVAALDGASVTSHWRMELTERDDRTIILNDAYNANPDAMASALETAAGVAGTNDRRLGVVLGDMLELGDEAETDHQELGRRTVAAGAAWAIFVGQWAQSAANAARAAGLPEDQVIVVQDGAAASAAVPQLLRSGDVVLIKGSRGMALETVAAQLALGGLPDGKRGSAR